MNDDAQMQMEIGERIYTLHSVITDLEAYIRLISSDDLRALDAAEDRLEMLIIAVMKQRRKTA